MKLVSTAAALLVASCQAADDKCYGLAMSGGGAYGAYEAGALYGMYQGMADKTGF